MPSINKVILIGHLGNDPEKRFMPNGTATCRYSIATSETWKDKNGEKQEHTEWHRIVVWGKLADICGKYLSKGRQVYVEGRLQTRSWEDNGQKKYTTEIVASTVQFLGSGNAEASSNNYAAGASSSNNDFGFQDFGPEPSFNQNEDVPF